MALELNNETFKESLESDKVVLVDFWAEWCGPCRMIAPIIDEVSEEFKDKAIIGKVNVDEQNDIAAQFGIRSIPTIVLFKNGEVVDKIVGAQPIGTFREKLNNHI